MEPKEFEELLNDVETRVDRLRALYENWFRGYEKLEPQTARKDVERRIYGLRKELPRNTGLRFRYNTLFQRYTTLTSYWHRTSKQIEEGTYRLQLQRLRRKKARDDELEAGRVGRAVRGPGENEASPPQSYELSLDEHFDVKDLLDDSELDAVARAVEAPGPFSDPPPTLQRAVSGAMATFMKPGASRQGSSPEPRPPAPSYATPLSEGPLSDGESTPVRGLRVPVVPLPSAPRSRPEPSAPRAVPEPSAPRGVPAPPAAATPRVPSAATPSQHGTRAPVPPPVPPHVRAPGGVGPVPKPPVSLPGSPITPSGVRTAPAVPGAGQPRPAAPGPTSPAKGEAKPAPPDSGFGEQRMKTLYEAYASARRQNNEGDVRYDVLAGSIRRMLPELEKKHAGKQIDFEIVMKDGRVGLKPKAT